MAEDESKTFEIKFTATVQGTITVDAEDEEDAKFEVEIGMPPKDVIDGSDEWEVDDVSVDSIKET